MAGSGKQFSISSDVAYGSLSLFTTVLHNIFLLYHVDIFVSVYKIDKASFWIGEIIFLLWNSLNDPVFGWISDRKYLKSSGKKDAQLTAGAVVSQRLEALTLTGPLFTLSFLAFWVQWTYPGLQFVICLCVYDGFLTMIDLHHSALMADISVSIEKRARLNAKSSLFSIIGTASVFVSYAVWNKDNLRSFRIFCAILTLISLVGFLVMMRVLKQVFKDKHELPAPEQDLSVQSSRSEKQVLRKFLGELSTQKNFIWFAGMNIIQVFHCHFNSNFFPLFLENLLGDAITPGFGSFLIGISFVAPHINNLYFLSLCQKYGVYRVIRLLFIIKLSLSLVMCLAGLSHTWLLCLFIASNRVFTEGTCKLLNLVITDLVDEDYVVHNRGQAVSALIFGTASLLSKPGQTLAPLVGTWLLAQQTGHDIFQSGQELGTMQHHQASLDPRAHELYRQGCFNLLVYIPILCAGLQLLVWSQFSLHGKRLRQIKHIREGRMHSPV